jgi:hypothetical protein
LCCQVANPLTLEALFDLELRSELFCFVVCVVDTDSIFDF